MFIVAINSKKQPKTMNSSSLGNGLGKMLFEIEKSYGEVDSPFVINSSGKGPISGSKKNRLTEPVIGSVKRFL